MTQHSRQVKVIKWLIDFKKQLIIHAEKIKRLYEPQNPPDFMMYQGVLRCQTSPRIMIDYLSKNIGRQISICSPPDPNIRPIKTPPANIQYEDRAKSIETQLWKNFDQPATPLVKRFFTENESLYFSPSTKSRSNSFTPLKIKNSGSKTEYSESLGTYMGRMSELALRKAPSSYKKRIVGPLLNFLRPFLFENIEQDLSPEEIILFEHVHQTTLKRKNWSNLDFKENTRKSAHPIEEYLAAKIIHNLINNAVDDFSWGRFYTLLYIWIALFSSFNNVRTTAKHILDLSFPDSLNNKNPIFLFDQKTSQLPEDLQNLLVLLKGKKGGKIFQINRSTIETVLTRLTQELGFNRKKNPQKPENFLLLTPETFLLRPHPCCETDKSEVTSPIQ